MGRDGGQRHGEVLHRRLRLGGQRGQPLVEAVDGCDRGQHLIGDGREVGGDGDAVVVEVSDEVGERGGHDAEVLIGRLQALSDDLYAVLGLVDLTG